MTSPLLPPAVALTIRDLGPGDELAFRQLNEAWITRFFVLEPKDIASLNDPQRSILDRGGRVFLAFLGPHAAGCCALYPIADGAFEVVKMAVSDSFQRAGIGRRLLEHTIAEARASVPHAFTSKPITSSPRPFGFMSP